MTTLTQSELNLYVNCFDALNRHYQKYLEYDNQLCNNLGFDEMDIDDLNILL